jgi:hypothetical protein
MIVDKNSNIRPGDIIWNASYPKETYTVKHVCTRDWHSLPCYVVSGRAVHKAHLGPDYYTSAKWKYKSSCMFGGNT